MSAIEEEDEALGMLFIKRVRSAGVCSAIVASDSDLHACVGSDSRGGGGVEHGLDVTTSVSRDGTEAVR
jgi:hypothetical protein